MAVTASRRQKVKERRRTTVDSRREQKTTEAVVLACSAVTHHLSYEKTKKTRPLIGLSLKQVGITDPRVFKDVLKEILDPIAPEIENLEIDSSQTLSSVIGMIVPILSR
jgi:hypothetical protein